MKKNLIDEGYLNRCEQCGRCSSACPITGENDFNIRQIIRYVEVSKVDKLVKNLLPCLCLTCGRCEEACPNDVNILRFIRTIRSYIPNELIPTVPCIEACPAKIDIPGFVRMVAKGMEHEALELIMQKVPIPGVLGRVCGRPCESKCRRNNIDSPVSICRLKRYVSSLENVDHVLERIYMPGKNSEKKVLVIGSGPAGLTAAYYLRKKGHSITIMEKKQKAGGMLRYGIPDYRLPKSVLNTEIDRIINMGIDLKTSTKLVDLINMGTTKNDFDAFFIATGLQYSRTLCMNNNFLGGITYGLDFLEGINSGHLSNLGNKVLVLGGGNVAVDVARSIIRLGTRSVTLVCLEKREEMLADPLEIKMALDEGVKFVNSWGINKFFGTTTLSGVELKKCDSVFDKSANFNPKFTTEKMLIDVDNVIIAIGQTYDKRSIEELLSFLSGDVRSKKHVMSVDYKNRVLGSKNIFAGGDAVRKPGSVIGAVVSGYNAAISIDCFLGGNGIFFSHDQSYCSSDLSEVIGTSKSSHIERQKTNMLQKNERIKCFSEIDRGLDRNKATIEASRCLSCDLEYHLACFS